MTETHFAQHQLRVIRTLMERATVYRAISAPTALTGGLLSLAGFVFASVITYVRQEELTKTEFLLLWLVILGLTLLANTLYLWRSSVQRTGPFFSPGMKLAAASLAPAFIFCAVFTCILAEPIDLALTWITLYGLALLATQHFAPRSLIILGWSFFITGCVLLLIWHGLLFPQRLIVPTPWIVSGLMFATFGVFHLIYAGVVWARTFHPADSSHV